MIYFEIDYFSDRYNDISASLLQVIYGD